MTNLEKYAFEIAKIACSEELFGVMRGDDKPASIHCCAASDF